MLPQACSQLLLSMWNSDISISAGAFPKIPNSDSPSEEGMKPGFSEAFTVWVVGGFDLGFVCVLVVVLMGMLQAFYWLKRALIIFDELSYH